MVRLTQQITLQFDVQSTLELSGQLYLKIWMACAHVQSSMTTVTKWPFRLAYTCLGPNDLCDYAATTEENKGFRLQCGLTNDNDIETA